MFIYEQIYKKLNNLLPNGIKKFCSDPEGHLKFKAKGFTDLNFDNISWKENNRKKTFRIAMAHNFIQNGDVMASPDMEIRIHVKIKMAEALTYQQDDLGLYQEVYPSSGLTNRAFKTNLNNFLLTWLKNVKKQGFKEDK